MMQGIGPQMAAVIRAATGDDLPAIVAIYNHEVRHGTATFDTEPWSVEGQGAWLAGHGTPPHPCLVATDGGLVVGWGTLSIWSTRCAYARTVEDSLYVHHDHRGRGVGHALLQALIARARTAGLAVILARIETSGTASLALHRHAGFTSIGVMHRVGEKFGRVLDVELLELLLEPR
jgi:phosphinothricin acetyltransferase